MDWKISNRAVHQPDIFNYFFIEKKNRKYILPCIFLLKLSFSKGFGKVNLPDPESTEYFEAWLTKCPIYTNFAILKQDP